jgi:hypothetical protein
MEPINPASKEVLRERAIRRMKKRRSFWEHLALYVVFNGAMVVLWAIEGTHDLGSGRSIRSSSGVCSLRPTHGRRS